MKMVQWLVVSAFMVGMAAPATAGVNDPEVIIYRFSRVRDNGQPGFLGVATVFVCTNFSGATETIRFVTRAKVGFLLQNDTISIDHLTSRVAATHVTFAYEADLNLATTAVNGGTTAIAATSTNITCTAMAIDASTPAPVGVALHGVRFNPAPGSQE
jgi:hypothetical protein